MKCNNCKEKTEMLIEGLCNFCYAHKQADGKKNTKPAEQQTEEKKRKKFFKKG